MSALSHEGEPGAAMELVAGHGTATTSAAAADDDAASDAAPTMSAKELCAKPRSSLRPSIPASRLSTATRTTRPSKFNKSIRFMDATFAHISPKLSPAFARGSPCCRPAECSVIIVQGLVGIDKLLAKRWLDARARVQLVILGLAFLRLWRIMAMHETTTESDSRDRPWTPISIVLHNARQRRDHEIRFAFHHRVVLRGRAG